MEWQAVLIASAQKIVRNLELIEHCSCGFNQGPVLPLRYPILLWSVGCGELMLDAFFIKEFFNLGVLEFGPVVTSHLLDWETELLLCPSHKDFHLFLHLTFIMHKEYPSEMGIIINNYNAIFVTANANVGDWSKEIHVK